MCTVTGHSIGKYYGGQPIINLQQIPASWPHFFSSKTTDSPLSTFKLFFGSFSASVDILEKKLQRQIGRHGQELLPLNQLCCTWFSL